MNSIILLYENLRGGLLVPDVFVAVGEGLDGESVSMFSDVSEKIS